MSQKQRIGGKWVICQAVFRRRHREAIRRVIGKDLIMINLKLDTKYQKPRLEKRHGKNLGAPFMNYLLNMSKHMQEISDQEENTFEITVTEEMTEEDVLDKVLKIID